jgi:hypothetical protein
MHGSCVGLMKCLFTCYQSSLNAQPQTPLSNTMAVHACREPREDGFVDVPQEDVASRCSEKPAVQRMCVPCTFCADEAANQGCNGNGSCKGNKCVCNAGWVGPTCGTPLLTCATGILDGKGLCCLSGVLTPTRECCESSTAVLDKNGKCCNSGRLDSCGECDGVGVGYDWEGNCCNHPGELMASMQCCASGVIDGCGMCDGDDSLCGVAVTLSTAPDSLGVMEEGIAQEQFKEAVKEEVCDMLSLMDLCEQVEVESVEASSAPVRRLQQNLVPALVHLKLTPLTAAQQATIIAAGRTAPGFSAAEVEGTLKLALASGDAGSTRRLAEVSSVITSVESVLKTFECGDSLCAPEERPVVGGLDPGTWCVTDCPFPTGECPAPSTGEAGSTDKVFDSHTY